MNWREIVVDAVWYALGGDREEEMGWKAEEDGAQSGSNSSRRGESGTNKNARPRQKKGNNETGEREREVEVEVEEKRKRGRERERETGLGGCGYWNVGCLVNSTQHYTLLYYYYSSIPNCSLTAPN